MTWHPSNLFWSRYAAGDLRPLERLRLHYHVQRCPRCAAERVALLAQRAAYQRAHAPPAKVRTRRGWGLVVLGPSLVGAMLLVLALQRPTPELSTAMRAKGGERFVLYTQEGDNAQPLGSLCHVGDRLRASYRSDRPYLMVIELDGAGRAQVVFPEGGAASGPIAATEVALTPGSWVLDDTPGVERFVALFSSEPLDAAAVLPRLQTHKTPEGAGVVMREIRCRKDA